MSTMGVAQFERFFRATAGLDVDKSDVKRVDDFVDQRLADLLLVAQAAASFNGRDVIELRISRSPRASRSGCTN